LQGIQLKKLSKVLYGPVQHALNVIAQFTTVLPYKERQAKQRVLVVRDLQTNELGYQL